MTSILRKQDLNTRNSIELELFVVVGIDDVCQHVYWINYFIETCGYKIEETMLFLSNEKTSYEVAGLVCQTYE